MTALSERPAIHFGGAQFATAPAEARGLERDEVRLLVGTADKTTHARFRDLPSFLEPGDLVVINDSATLAAQLRGTWARGAVVIHLATPLDDGTWVVELRTAPNAARSVLDATPGDVIQLDEGPPLTLRSPYSTAGSSPTGVGNRLWIAETPGDLRAAMATSGRPIAYGYLDDAYPLADYQTIFATRPGSAEMPSAARPFTDRLVTRLSVAGVSVAPITLHTGVSSQEAGEAPQPERFAVSATTARLVNHTRVNGGRVVAAGTTVVRALESAVSPSGHSVAAAGWTSRVVTPDDPPAIVTGLITGWHDPHASHLLLVEAVAGQELAQRAYDAAVGANYLWHEFGDSALLLP